MRPLLAGVAIWWSGPRRKSVGFVSGPGLIRYPDKFGPSTSLKVIAYYYKKKVVAYFLKTIKWSVIF